MPSPEFQMLDPETIGQNAVHLRNSIQRGIYFLLREQTIVYVGQSVNCFNRIISHLSDNVKVFDGYFIQPIPDLAISLDQVETQYILTFKPVYNCNIPKTDLYMSMGELLRVHRAGKTRLRKLVLEGKLHPVDLHDFRYFRTDELEQVLGIRRPPGG